MKFGTSWEISHMAAGRAICCKASGGTAAIPHDLPICPPGTRISPR